MGENSEVEMKETTADATPAMKYKSENSTTITTSEKTLKRPPIRTAQTTNSPNKEKKLRLEIPTSVKSLCKNPSKNTTFMFGNYDRYYGYRNTNEFTDIRLNAFQKHRSLFEGSNILDIGCNNGLVTISIARDFNVKHIVGIDIDKNLVGKARRFLNNEKRNSDANKQSFPFNVEFEAGNYVLTHEKLLELETEKFDTILCLSVTKWIHLNCGDVGMKLAFRRMYKQLLPGGRLILEAQDWKSYKRRKNLTPSIAANYNSIKFFPEQFDEYLLGNEVGFQRVFTIDVPKHDAKGFQRPIKVFVKRGLSSTPTEESSVC